jgi:hypothetical protein
MRCQPIVPILASLTACLLACDPPSAAPSTDPIAPRETDVCDAACSPGASCCTERFVHGSGASVGWTRRGAAMFSVADAADTSAVLAEFKQWIADAPTRADLSAAMPNTSALAGLVPGSVPPRHHGSLVLHRFTQTYRGLPVVGAGEHVSVTVAPGHGAVSVSGAIVDARDAYPGWDAAITPEAALAAASELLTPGNDELEPVPFTFGEPRLVAVAEVRTLAWEIEVARDGHSRGTLLLRANTGAMLAFSPAAHFGPDDPVAVKVRARTFASDFFDYNDPSKQVVANIGVDPVTGEPLLGSTYTPLACKEDPNALPVCGQTRLGNPQIVVLDADHQNFFGDKTSHPRIGASPTGEFLATPPATAKEDSPMRDDAALQDFFHRLQATYSMIDGYHAGKWDALRGSSSGFPVTAYKPRVVLAHNTNILLTCGFSQPGCATIYWPFVVDDMTQKQLYDEHPEADLPPHVWDKDVNSEAMGFIGTGVDGFTSPDLVFHEFGHVVDLFTAPGFIGRQVVPSGCVAGMKMGGKCAAACVLDSTDEGLALAETVADMIDLFSVGQLYTTVEYTRCEAISSISTSGPVHDAACMDDPGDIKSFLDQRPVEPGMLEIDGMWIPTGRCGESPGYRQSGVLQAWWEWTHARNCAPGEPFACEGFADEAAGARSGIEALLFAMSQTNATYYRKLFTDMEIYLACTDGPEQAARFRQVFCHHGALACDGLPPVCPATCGDGKAELTEACDGDDLRGQQCFDHGFVAGTLTCKADCTYDLSACTQDAGTTSTTGTTGQEPAPVPTTPTSGSDIPTLGEDSGLPPPSGSTDSEDSAGGEQAEDGCGCRGSDAPGSLLALVLLALRRRRMDSVASAGVR